MRLGVLGSQPLRGAPRKGESLSPCAFLAVRRAQVPGGRGQRWFGFGKPKAVGFGRALPAASRFPPSVRLLLGLGHAICLPCWRGTLRLPKIIVCTGLSVCRGGTWPFLTRLGCATGHIHDLQARWLLRSGGRFVSPQTFYTDFFQAPVWP